MKKLFIFMSLAWPLLFAGCEEKEEGRSMSVDKTTLLFDREGNATDGRVVTVTSTVDWVAHSDQTWCTISPSSTRGSAEIGVAVAGNAGFAERTAHITIVSSTGDFTHSVTVTQSENDYTLSVTPAELQFDMEGNPGASGNVVGINSNDSWTIGYEDETDMEWLTLSRTSGKGSREVTFTAGMNFEVEDRVANLTVTAGDKILPITVTQDRSTDEAKILSFDIPSLGVTGVVDEQAKTVKLVTAEPATSLGAVAAISEFASISPDPAVARSYESPVEFTVTAFNGSQVTYTVSVELPAKFASGFRPGSAKLLWAKTLSSVGVSAANMTNGIAVTNDHVVIDTRNAPSIYLDRYTGEKLGEIALGAGATGSLVNFYNTADESGNVLINSLATGAGTFNMWKLTGTTGPAVPYLSYPTPQALGRKVSIKGSLDGDAIITSGVNVAGTKFARWQVTGGSLVSTTPDLVTITGLANWSNNNVDVVYSSADPTSDYFVASYSNNTIAWVDGTTNAVKALLPQLNANFIANAIDHTVFNGKSYILYNHVNAATWGAADQVFIANASTVEGFTATNDANAVPTLSGAVEWLIPNGTYGANNSGGAVNANGTGDVAFKVSKNGYYLHVYFMFTNGQVACYRMDCLAE